MTVELITGHAGAAHISSADAGWFNAGAFGSGKYVLDTSTQLAATVQSANLITIGVGDALFEGRHVRVSATENVAIDNGAQGVGRHDLICIKYDYDSVLDVESASIEVIKGTAAANPTDPTIPSGSILSGASTAYMPLWRIVLDGISVQTPEQMFALLPSAASSSSATIPISRGGTNATTASAALQNIMGGKTVLYNNSSGTTGTVTLSNSAANFNHMRIYFRSNRNSVDYYSSVDVYSPNGKTVSLECMIIDGSYAYHNYKAATISGTSITNTSGYGWYGNNASSATTVGQNNIYITRVEAWNE